MAKTCRSEAVPASRAPWFGRSKPRPDDGEYLLDLRGGPLDGATVTLSSRMGNTLPIVLHGQRGRYIGGQWQPANA